MSVMGFEGADTPPLHSLLHLQHSLEQAKEQSEQNSSSQSLISEQDEDAENQTPSQFSPAISEKRKRRLKARQTTDLSPEKSVLRVTDDLVLRLSNDFTPLCQSNWDTLVYIGPPSKLRTQTQFEYDHIRKHFEQPLLIQSSSLKALDSGKFERLLRPNACIRAEKKLKKLDVMQKIGLPEKDEIKYHIDLRPPNEDDEAIILLTELTCTHGILHWHLVKTKYGISSTRILGTDEFDTPSNPYYVSPLNFVQRELKPTEKIKRFALDRKVEKSQNGVEATPIQEENQLPAAPEYLPMRHHSALERLLHAIAGNDPKLDSAPKVWTFFALAKYFECAQKKVVNKWIDKWLYDGGNVNFIQNNPEVAYRIGMGVESIEIVQAAFSILVGEKALLRVCTEWDEKDQNPICSSHGRVFEFLDDDDKNRIDHAASSLVHRIRKKFRTLSVEMQWMEQSEEYSKLNNLDPQNDQERDLIHSFKTLLRDFVRGKMYAFLCRESTKPFTDLDQFAVDVKVLRQGKFPQFTAIYNRLNQPMRLFTRTYWMALQRISFQTGNNTSCDEIEDFNGGQRLLKPMIEAWITDPENGIKMVAKESLKEAASDVAVLIEAQGKKTLEDAWQNSHPAYKFPFLPVQSPKRSSDITQPDSQSPDKRRKTDETKELPLRPALPKPWSEMDDEEKETGIMKPEQSIAPARVSGQAVVDRIKTPVWRWQTQGGTSVEEPDFGMGSTSLTDNEDWEEFPSSNEDHNPSTNGSTIDARSESSKVRDSTKQTPVDYIFPIDLSPGPTKQARSKMSNKIAVGAEDGNVVSVITPRWGPGPALLPDNTVVGDGDTTKTPRTIKSSPQDDEDAVPDGFHSDQKGYMEPFDTAAGVPVYRLRQTQQSTTADTSDITPNIFLDVDAIVDTAEQPASQLPVESNSWDEGWSDNPHASRNEITVAPIRSSKPTTSFHLDQQAVKKARRYEPFDLNELLSQMSQILSKKCEEIVYPPHLFHGSTRVPIDLVDTLTCLEDDEWKYLPLWAGGCDDGTGGVFEEIDVPNLETGGFRGGKRGYRSNSRSHDMDTTESDVSGTETDSSFDDIGSEAISTVGRASKIATDGTRTVKSLDSEFGTDKDSESGFMSQDEIYESIREMKIEEARKGKAKAGTQDQFAGFANLARQEYNADDSDNDHSTVMGAGSDVQGDMFHDIDDDDDDNNNKNDDFDIEKISNGENESDDEMEIIDKDNL